ncbi:hypothetical protein LTR53_010909, partial [Teratosphaeriaceae sp. CCFEE 6253]
DLFRRFPPELRNKIYAFICSATATNNRSSITIRFGSFRPGSSRQHESLRWKEPGLLLAAKWIRLEANYYQTRPIEIAVTTADFAAACRWLRAIAADVSEEKILGSVTFRLVGCNWDDVCAWLPLAELVREYTFFDSLSPLTQRGTSRAVHRLPVVKASNDRESNFAEALKQIVALGVTARQQGSTRTELESAYLKWVSVRIQHSTSKRHRRRGRAS